MAKRSMIVVMSLMIIFTSGCAKIIPEAEQLIQQVDLPIIHDVEEYLYQQGLDPNEVRIRTEIVARAAIWVGLRVPYLATNDPETGYRRDCSGFVSYAWDLRDSNGNPISPDTISLGNTFPDISLGSIQPGDIINNKKKGDIGHVVLFVSWIGNDQTKFIAFEENGGYGKAVQTELTIEYLNDSFTISEYDSIAPGPYYVQQPPNIP